MKTEKTDNVKVDVWILKDIEDTLRQCWNNIEHDTCIGRNINQSRVLIDKLLKGKQIIGSERFEHIERI